MHFRKRDDTVNGTVKAPPPPQTIPPSGTFDGNDGQWSSFLINTGDSDGSGGGQNFKVLVSTSSPVVLVPGISDWCDEDCAQKRGVQLFQGGHPLGQETGSGSWQNAGIYDIPLPNGWLNDTNKPGATWALDNVGLGSSSEHSLILEKRYVVGSKSEDFFMGYFGLAAGRIAPGAGKDSINPFLTEFAFLDKIPSISYGYTAGAKYRNGNGALGNLVLGGYDETRVDMRRGVSIDMPNQQNNSLVVGVPSITYYPQPGVEDNGFSFTTETKGFKAIIDSTLPYLWLPDKVCDHFAERFNLAYDKKTNFYTVNSTAASKNSQQNATVSFKIAADALDSSSFADIRLPWSAFDLSFTKYPNGNATKYFPLKKSPDGRFVLGRAFLQEAYLVTDYERLNFTVAPAIAPGSPSPSEKLIPIYRKDYKPPGPTLIPGGGGGGGGLSGGAIAGIVVGMLVVLFGVAVGLFLWWKKKRAAKNELPPNYKEATEIDTAAAGNEVKHRRISELDSHIPGMPKSPAGYYGNNEGKGFTPIGAISEMDSPPAELPSPPLVASTPYSEGSGGPDYFTAGGRLGRRGATRESSGNNTPGTPPLVTPMAELPGDHIHSSRSPSPPLKAGALHTRGPSDTGSLHNNKIDEVMKRSSADPPRSEGAAVVTENGKESEKHEHTKEGDAEGEALERRPSHTRGLSDTTVQSDTTVVSQPTPEELESWASAEDEHPRRPLSE